MRIIPFLASLLLVALGAPDAIGQSHPRLFSRLDSIAGADVAEERAVGLVIAVMKGKDQLLLEAYGNADLDGGVPITANSVIPIGSVTKQFTAAAIMQHGNGHRGFAVAGGTVCLHQRRCSDTAHVDPRLDVPGSRSTVDVSQNREQRPGC